MTTGLKWGDWNAICQVCGFKFKANQLRKRWDSLMVCKEDWEPRHPQDLIKQPKEDTSVPWTSPERSDTFIADPGYVAASVGSQENTIPSGTFNNEL